MAGVRRPGFHTSHTTHTGTATLAMTAAAPMANSELPPFAITPTSMNRATTSPNRTADRTIPDTWWHNRPTHKRRARTGAQGRPAAWKR